MRRDLMADAAREMQEQDSPAATMRAAVEVALGVPLPGLVKRQAAKQIVRSALSDLKRRVESM